MLSEENDNHGLRYKKRLQKIEKIVGRENIHVRTFEDRVTRKKGGICYDFLRTIGIDPDLHEWVKSKAAVNERISGPAVNLKRIFNEYLAHRVGSKEDILDRIPNHIGRYNQIFSRLSTEYVKTMPEKDYYLSAGYRMRLKKLFEADNEYIAQEFLGKKAGETLFEDDNWTADRTVQPLTINEEMLLRLLYEVCYNDEVREQLSSQIPE